jgi:hypothetical protein
MLEVAGLFGEDAEQLQSFFPLWLREESRRGKIEPYIYELADYEWSLSWIKKAAQLSKYASQRESDLSHALLELNPFVRVLRLTHDIHGWVEAQTTKLPIERLHVLLISPNSILEASFQMAAIMDELTEAPASADQLINKLQGLYKDKQGWSEALTRLLQTQVVQAKPEGL